MEIAPGIHNVITEQAPAPGVTNTYLIPAVIYPGQGPVVTNPRAKLRELIQHRREREAQIVALLTQGPKSVEDLFRIIHSGLDERLSHLARNQIRSHLAKLETDGRVSETGQTYRVTTPG